MNKEFKTPKGTHLPLLNLKGKDYLQAAYRIVWFREERPTWRIETEYIKLEKNFAIAKATIKDEQGNVIATAHKQESAKGFADFIEKCETGAIGRALAMIGFGTQFATEFDEVDRIVDSPVGREATNHVPDRLLDHPGDYKVTFGKYNGKHLSDVPPLDLQKYVEWLKDNNKKQNKAPSPMTINFFNAVENYITDLKHASQSLEFETFSNEVEFAPDEVM